MPHNILLFGDDGTNTLGLMRSLGEKGIKTSALITHNRTTTPIIKKSRYCLNCIICEKNYEVSAQALISYGENNIGTFLIPSSDFALKTISDNYDVLSKYFVLPSIDTNIGKITDIMSKTKMAEYARMVGFEIPFMRKVIVTDALIREIQLTGNNEMQFPLIIKSDSICETGCEFKIVQTINELTAFLLKNIGSTVIIQSYIENAEELAIQGVGFGGKKSPLVFGSIHKIRTSVFSLGTTTYAKLLPFEEDSTLASISKKFAMSLKYNGIFDLDVLKKGEKYYFIECNFRNGSNGYSYTRMGANLPYLWINGLTFDDKEELCLKRVRLVSDIGDFAHVLKGTINPIKWFFQYITADVRLEFNFKDQAPFWAEVLHYLKRGRRHET